MLDKEVILRVVRMYRDRPYLWDKHHPHYAIRARRDAGIQEILDVYRELEPRATARYLKTKIQNLRTNYLKELHKMIASQRPGEEGVYDYVPTLYYFDAFSFIGSLDQTVYVASDQLKTEFSELSDEVDQHETESLHSDISDVVDQNETESLHSNISHESKRKITEIEKVNHLEKKDDFIAPTMNLQKNKTKDEDCEILGKAIGLQLRDLDKTSLRITQKIISDAIYYASIGALTVDSHIALGSQGVSDVTKESPSSSSSRRYHPYHAPVCETAPPKSSSLHSPHSSD